MISMIKVTENHAITVMAMAFCVIVFISMQLQRQRDTRVCCFVSASRDLSDLGVAFCDLFTHTHRHTHSKAHGGEGWDQR